MAQFCDMKNVKEVDQDVVIVYMENALFTAIAWKTVWVRIASSMWKRVGLAGALTKVWKIHGRVWMKQA